jgi:putative transposase
MLKAYKYRLNPSQKQAELINKHIGSCRFIYNLALETKQMAFAGSKANLSCFALHKQLTDLKTECSWLKEIASQALQQSITDLDSAYTRFFKNQSQFPKYKSKHGQKQSFRIPQNTIIDNENNKLIIPKFKEGIDIVLHRPIKKGAIKQCTISKTPTGKYFASILVDTQTELPVKSKIKDKTSIGIDLGIKSFIVTSNGEKIDNPTYYRKAQSKLSFLQRKYSKHKGKKTKQKFALQHEKVANQRKDFLHKLSSKLISENQTICLEDLAVNNMIQNHCLAKSIQDAGWGMFVDMLKYKAEWYGNNIVQIGTFEPSSKTCSSCGHIKRDLTLNDRDWECSKCKTVHDRDVNAAVNIKSFALRNKLYSERILKSHGQLPTLVGALTHEAPTL